MHCNAMQCLEARTTLHARGQLLVGLEANDSGGCVNLEREPDVSNGTSTAAVHLKATPSIDQQAVAAHP